MDKFGNTDGQVFAAFTKDEDKNTILLGKKAVDKQLIFKKISEYTMNDHDNAAALVYKMQLEKWKCSFEKQNGRKASRHDIFSDIEAKKLFLKYSEQTKLR